MTELLFYRAVGEALFVRYEQHPLPDGMPPDEHPIRLLTTPNGQFLDPLIRFLCERESDDHRVIHTWIVYPDPWDQQPSHIPQTWQHSTNTAVRSIGTAAEAGAQVLSDSL